ncbi:MAG: peptidoglycan binding domain-containing protein, partial [Bacillota bacterium]|nr:peptidoglycan binding domain-containing protein [Bacillota bacterium]
MLTPKNRFHIFIRHKGVGITEGENKIEKKKGKKIIIGIIISLCTLLVIYLGMAVFFISHFYFGTEINGVSISGSTVKEANRLMAEKLQSYTLNLKERGDKTEQIKASEIGLRYNIGEDFQNYKDKQNPFKWIFSIFNKDRCKITEGVTYDDGQFKECIDKLSCFDSSNIIEPRNPSFRYEGSSYVIIDEVKGSKVDKDILFKHASDVVIKGSTAMDFESIDCYVKPQYTSKSQKIIDIKDMLNKYVSAKITYT